MNLAKCNFIIAGGGLSLNRDGELTSFVFKTKGEDVYCDKNVGIKIQNLDVDFHVNGEIKSLKLTIGSNSLDDTKFDI